MKKIFVTMLLAITLIFIGGSQAEAQEIYMGNYSDGTPVYLISESLNGGSREFTCRVHAGYAYIHYHFYITGGGPYYQNSEGYRGYVYGGESPVAEAIWEYAHR